MIEGSRPPSAQAPTAAAADAAGSTPPAGRRRPVPIPLGRRWSRFRQFGIPPLVFVAAALSVAHLWRDHFHPMDIQGEALHSTVTLVAPEAGYLATVLVAPEAIVAVGDPIAVVMGTDPELLESSLAVLRAEVDLLVAGMDPLIPRRRADYDHQQLLVALMGQRIDLTTARIRLAQAEVELQRVAELGRDNAVSQADVERAQLEVDALGAEISGREQLVNTLQANLENLDLTPPAGSAAAETDPIEAAIRVHEARLRLLETQSQAHTLTAPLSGVVGRDLRRRGEYLLAGEPVAVIAGTEPGQLIGYLPQPLRFTPESGMRVEVITRTQPRRRAEAAVVSVDPAFIVPPETVPLPRSRRYLPLVIEVPGELGLRPGEWVDLRLHPGTGLP